MLLTVSKDIKFITAKHMATCTTESLSKHLDHVIQVYTQAGFNVVRTILMDGKFEKVKNGLPLESTYFVVLWLNAFPAKSGISATYSPQELLVCWKLNYKKHCRVLPGTYCKTHDEPVPTNTMTPCTHQCIACGPTGILQGSIKFYCLTMGRILKCRSFTAMPMPDRAIKHVNTIGSRAKQGRMFRFTDRSNELYK